MIQKKNKNSNKKHINELAINQKLNHKITQKLKNIYR